MKQMKKVAVVLLLTSFLGACSYGVAGSGGTGGFGMSVGTGLRF